MTDEVLIQRTVAQLRTMARDGQHVPAMLRRIQQALGRPHCGILSVRCFCLAFHAGIQSTKAVAGWSGFGGELSDAQVDSLVLPVVEDYRDRIRDTRSE